MKLHPHIKQAILDHGLPFDFSVTVNDFYAPLARKLNDNIKQQTEPLSNARPKFIGIQGSQGLSLIHI